MTAFTRSRSRRAQDKRSRWVEGSKDSTVINALTTLAVAIFVILSET
jgi:hypothetical protein